MNKETVYKIDSKGKQRVWSIWVEEVNPNKSFIHIESGLLDGKKVLESIEITEGKNIGKSNETTPYTQAVSEAQAKLELKLRGEYVRDLENASQGVLRSGIDAPMLAQKYHPTGKQKGSKTLDKMNIKGEKIYVQPKLDGCFTGSTLVLTDRGFIKIQDIVENKLECKVKSLNMDSNTFEWKSITNYFSNGNSDRSNWRVIKVTGQPNTTATLNHKILTNKGWVEVQNLDEKTHLIRVDSKLTTRFDTLLGSVLGDASVYRDGSNLRLSISHNNIDYVNFKRDLWGFEGSVVHRISGYGSEIFSVSKSVNKEMDLPVSIVFDSNGRRRFFTANELSKCFTDRTLAIWYYDDGSLQFNNGNPKTPRISISVHRYSNEQVEEFVRFFIKYYGVNPTAVLDKRVKNGSGKFLTFTTKDSLYILNKIRFYAVKGMEYKNYFPIEDYISKDEEFKPFKICMVRNTRGDLRKYDIEVQDNHNYIANGNVVHNCRGIIKITSKLLPEQKRSDFGLVDLDLNSVKATMYTRKGDIMPVQLKHVLEEVISKYKELHLMDVHHFEEITLDGELFSSELTFNELNGHLKRKDNQDLEALSKIKYHLYDVQFTATYDKRYSFISNFKSSSVDIIPNYEILANENLIDKMLESFLSEGHEGLMIRTLNSGYENKRTWQLCKYKVFEDSEYKILDLEEDSMGRLGFVVLELGTPTKDRDGKTVTTFKAGLTGIDHAEGKKMLANKEQYIGKMATVEYFGLSEYKIPRFPKYKGVRE